VATRFLRTGEASWGGEKGSRVQAQRVDAVRDRGLVFGGKDPRVVEKRINQGQFLKRGDGRPGRFGGGSEEMEKRFPSFLHPRSKQKEREYGGGTRFWENVEKKEGIQPRTMRSSGTRQKSKKQLGILMKKKARGRRRGEGSLQ